MITAAWNEGLDAFRAGMGDCPYAAQDGLNIDRYNWWMGYLHGRTAHLL